VRILTGGARVGSAQEGSGGDWGDPETPSARVSQPTGHPARVRAAPEKGGAGFTQSTLTVGAAGRPRPDS